MPSTLSGRPVALEPVGQCSVEGVYISPAALVVRHG